MLVCTSIGPEIALTVRNCEIELSQSHRPDQTRLGEKRKREKGEKGGKGEKGEKGKKGEKGRKRSKR